MPELAEVEVVRRNVSKWWTGRRASEVCIIDEALLRQSDGADVEEALRRELVEMKRRGKYLMALLQGGQIMVFHFRMTGKLILSDVAEPRFARLSWRVGDGEWIVFKDQRRLGEVRLFQEGEFEHYEPLKKMGPEPEDVTVEYLSDACSDRRMLKAALLDQGVVAGVGNIAISEIFWRLKLPPQVRCGQVSDDEWERLVEEMPVYFDEIIERSMADEIVYVEEANSENIFDVYGRGGQPCPRCGTEIEKLKVAGRTSYFCPKCQG